MKTRSFIYFAFTALLMCSYYSMYAHCDTMDGPVVADARKAIEQNNINYVLKWVKPAFEKEITQAFGLIMKVRILSPEAKELSDNYFFETLVRLHRSGEGEPFTGVQPSGTPIDKKIIAADNSIASGDLSPLNDLVPKEKLPELKKRFNKVMSLKNFDVNNVQSGRKYIEAYVQFFHFAEGEEEGHNPGPMEEGGHFGYISWILSGIFFFTSVLFAILYYRKR